LVDGRGNADAPFLFTAASFGFFALAAAFLAADFFTLLLAAGALAVFAFFLAFLAIASLLDLDFRMH
jgi:hypothetical protein